MKQGGRLNILILSLYGRGGMIQYSSHLANALGKHHETTVLIPTYTVPDFFDSQVNLMRLNAPTSMFRTALLSCCIRCFMEVIKSIKRLQPDIIHVMDNHPWYILLLPFLRNFPIIVTQHDVVAHPGEPFRGRVAIAVNRYLNRCGRLVIVHGEKLRQMMMDRGMAADRLAVMPIANSSIFSRWRPQTIREEAHTLLFFGRILHYKGLDVLLKAMPQVIREVPDVRLLIAGEGSLAPYKKQVELLAPHIEVTNGFIPEQEVPRFFQRASIVVLPYREASQSGIVPLAYAFRKAVIATEVGSLPEAVVDGKTGILVPPEDAEGLSTAIIALLRDTTRRKRLAKAGSVREREELDGDRVAGKLVHLYHAVLSSQGGSGAPKERTYNL